MAIHIIKSDLSIRLRRRRVLNRLSDGGGLYLLSLRGGQSRAWRFDYTFRGKRKTVSLGLYPQVGLAQARRVAAVYRSMVAAGFDPSLERKRTGPDGLLQSTLGYEGRSFTDVALEWHATFEDWDPVHARTVKSRLRNHVFPLIGSTPIEKIGAADISRVCLAIQARSFRDTARRVFAYCRRICGFAVSLGLLPLNRERLAKPH